VATKTDLLRVQDVRDADRLIGECRDLGSEPTLWQRRMVDGLRRLVGVPVIARERSGAESGQALAAAAPDARVSARRR